LRGLARHNDREWFEPRRAIYERALKQPMLALIDEINTAMEDFAPEHVRPPHKIMMRIYRDIRFAADKRPYKRHVSAWWARRGMEKTSGGGFYLHIHPDEVLVSCGVYMPERDQLLAIRRYLSEHHEEYRALHKKIVKSKGLSMTDIDGALLTRMPKGFAKDDPADELLRARNWGVHASLPASLAEQPTLLREIVKRFKLAAPLVAMLNAPIVGEGRGYERRGM
ncbi:MAG: DUF2461 domain-containing protein, partial [Acidobacteriaceae bacterium]